MNILVTGTTSSIGTSLVSHVERAPAHIYTLNRWRQGGPQDAKNRLADLTDPVAVRDALDGIRPDIVIHLAANASTSYALDHPVEVMHVNALGTAGLVRACQKAAPDLTAFILASSAEVFGGQTEMPLDEESIPIPTTYYAVAKLAAEGIVRASGLPYVILRNHNTYGRANVGNANVVVDKFIQKALRGEEIDSEGDFRTRDFLFREDHVRAYLSVLDHLPLGETICFSSGHEATKQEIGRMVVSAVGRGKLAQCPPPRADGMPRLLGNAEKARRLLGWEPIFGLEAGITKAVEEWRARNTG